MKNIFKKMATDRKVTDTVMEVAEDICEMFERNGQLVPVWKRRKCCGCPAYCNRICQSFLQGAPSYECRSTDR